MHISQLFPALIAGRRGNEAGRAIRLLIKGSGKERQAKAREAVKNCGAGPITCRFIRHVPTGI